VDFAVVLCSGLGVLIGLILALTGAGGGVLAVPLLIFGLQMRVSDAAPVALFAVGISAALGAAMGLRSAHVRYRAAALMAALGFIGAPAGLWLGRRIPNAPLMLVFAAVLAYSALRMFTQARMAQAGSGLPAHERRAPCTFDPAEGRLRWTPACARALGGAGLVAGLLSTLLGVGGGFVIVPALVRVTDLDMKSVTATSLAVIALISAGSIGLTWVAGHTILWSAALPFAAGAVVGLLVGRRIALIVSGQRLQQTFAIVGLFVAVVLAYRSQA